MDTYFAMVLASGGEGSYDLIIALVLAVVAAVVGGLVAYWLKQPLLIGYLLGGLLIGPYTPGPIAKVENVQILAEIGVALLMFALGTEFSIQELKHVGKPALFGGLLQVSLTIMLGIPLGMALNLNFSSDIFLGGLIAISSSIVILKLLLARGELESLHGRLALGIGIVQDLSLIVLVVVLPTLGENTTGSNLVLNLGLALLKGVLFLGGSYLVGTKVIPWLLERVILLGSREMFLLVVISIALGMAILAYALEISFALGAFVAGLIVSGSEAANDVLNEIIPIRDVFASLFFVSIGMLIDPAFLWNNLASVLLVVITIILGKWLIVSGLLTIFKQPLKTAALAGLLLAQVGEFSFVLASIGVDSKVIDQRLEKLLLSAALITIIANPLLLQAFPTFVMWVTYIRDKIFVHEKFQIIDSGAALPISMKPNTKPKDHLEAGNLDGLMLKVERDLRSQTERWPFKKHVIVCGYGRVGRELVDACQRRNFEVVVIELEQRRVEAARKKGVLTFYGDSSVEATLKQANVEQAKVLAITVPDLIVAEATTRLAHQLNPNLEIITRATETRAVQILKQVGANEVVQPEFEAGVEFIRRTARLYGVGGVELQGLVNGWRTRYYGKKDG